MVTPVARRVGSCDAAGGWTWASGDSMESDTIITVLCAKKSTMRAHVRPWLTVDGLKELVRQ
jgi:hypothetical protein